MSAPTAVRTPPRVSVIIAAYNAADTIGLSIRSALAEPEVGEVWVVDDRSTDGTVREALAADDGSGRLRIRSQTQNGGPAVARNRALAASGCPWVCVLDADDYFLPGRIGRLLRRADGVTMIADELTRISQGALPPAAPPDMGSAAADITFEAFVEGNISRPGRYREELGFIKPLMNRYFLEEHDIQYDPGLRLGEDYHLYARILARGGTLRLLPPQGYVAVTRSNSISGSHTIADLKALRDADLDLLALPVSSKGRRALRRHYRSVDQRLQWRRLIDRVKAGDPAGMISTFTSIPVAGFLALRLAEQAWIRLGRAIRPSP